MEYLTSNEIAKLWNVSNRRVTTLARSGRIPCAKLVGHTWLIPNDATKPSDNRYTSNKKDNPIYINNKDIGNKEEESEFFFPLLAYSNYDNKDYVNGLSIEQRKLLEAEKIFISNNMDISYPMFLELFEASNNELIKIGALYYLSFTELLRSNFNKFHYFYNSLKALVISKERRYPVLKLILNDINCIVKGDVNLGYISDFNYILSTDDMTLYPYIICYLFKENTLKMLSSKGNRDLSMYEVICKDIESKGYTYLSQFLHILLAIMYKILHDSKNKLIHIRKAVKIMYENNIYATISEVAYYLSDGLEEVYKEYPSIVKDTIKEGNKLYITSINKIAMHYNGSNIPTLSMLDYKYIGYALNGMANKEIAILLHISEAAVSKKYKSICEKFLVDSKEELANKYLHSIFNPYLIVE